MPVAYITTLGVELTFQWRKLHTAIYYDKYYVAISCIFEVKGIKICIRKSQCPGSNFHTRIRTHRFDAAIPVIGLRNDGYRESIMGAPVERSSPE